MMNPVYRKLRLLEQKINKILGILQPKDKPETQNPAKPVAPNTEVHIKPTVRQEATFSQTSQSTPSTTQAQNIESPPSKPPVTFSKVPIRICATESTSRKAKEIKDSTQWQQAITNIFDGNKAIITKKSDNEIEATILIRSDQEHPTVYQLLLKTKETKMKILGSHYKITLV